MSKHEDDDRQAVSKEVHKAESLHLRKIHAAEKKELREKRIKRKILDLFTKTKREAAVVIQRHFRGYLVLKREEEERRVAAEEEEDRLVREATRLNEIIKHKQQSRQLKTLAKKYVGKIITNVADGVKILPSIVAVWKKWRSGTLEKQEIACALLQYSHAKMNKQHVGTKKQVGPTSLYNTTIAKYRKSIKADFVNCVWFDQQCEKLMLRYILWTEDMVAFRRLWVECLDFKGEGNTSTSVYDFFDRTGESKSSYGLWLFEAAGVKAAETLTFSQYFQVVTASALLSKENLLGIIFNSSTKDCLRRDDWKTLIHTMLDSEAVQHPKKVAIRAFDSFASKDTKGNDVLYYEDFVEITMEFPFVANPMFRLHRNLRRNHIGERFWRSKAREHQKAYARALREDKDENVL